MSEIHIVFEPDFSHLQWQTLINQQNKIATTKNIVFIILFFSKAFVHWIHFSSHRITSSSVSSETTLCIILFLFLFLYIPLLWAMVEDVWAEHLKGTHSKGQKQTVFFLCPFTWQFFFLFFFACKFSQSKSWRIVSIYVSIQSVPFNRKLFHSNSQRIKIYINETHKNI